MLRNLVWLGIVTSLSITSVACVSADPDESEIDEATAQPLSNAGGVGKVTICHKGHSISVGAPAVAAHLNHGDSVGACGSGDGGGGEPAGNPGPVCAADGAACSGNADCCGGLCGGSGICVSSCTVGPELGGAACDANTDCCSGACIFGSCYEGTTCHLPGTACDPTVDTSWCCFGSWCGIDGTCQ